LSNLTLNMQTKVAELMSAAEETKAASAPAESAAEKAESAPEVDECQRHVEDGGRCLDGGKGWERLGPGRCLERGNSRGTNKIWFDLIHP